MEEYQKKHGFNAHKKVREITPKNKRKKKGLLKDENTNQALDTNDKLMKWTKYRKTPCTTTIEYINVD